MENRDKFEEVLLSHLTDINLDKGTLKKYSATLTQLHLDGVQFDQIFKYGVPATQGVILKARVSLKNLSKIAKLFEIPLIKKVEGFPLGIPFPDYLEIKVHLADKIDDLGHGL